MTITKKHSQNKNIYLLLLQPKVIMSLSIVTAVFLCIIKAIGIYKTGSISVLSAFVDSALDIVSSLMLFFAIKFSAEPPDNNHRFGHQKVEPLAILIQSIIIFISASLLLREAIFGLFTHHKIIDGNYAMFVLFISLILSLLLVTIQTLAIKKNEQIILYADRAHYIGDVFMNGGLLLSVWISINWHFYQIDSMASILAAAILFWGGIKIIKQSVPQLLDAELSSQQKKQIIEIINANQKIKGFHDLRTRKAGDKTFIQFHIEFEPSLTILKCHIIAENIENNILEKFPSTEVFIHQDPHGHDNHDRLSDLKPPHCQNN